VTILKEFPELSRANTALLIIDMQRDFLDDDAACLIPGGKAVIPAIQRLLAGCREAGIPIIHAITIWRKGGVDVSPFTTSEELRVRGLREGEKGIEVVPELAPREGEHIVVKKKYSAFYLTDLELLLRSLGVVYVVIAGVATNYCVRSTVHDASFRDYMSIVPPETSRSYTVEEHERTLKDIANGFGKVIPLDEVLQELGVGIEATPSR
jgi:nicotinamidase-related amidase